MKPLLVLVMGSTCLASAGPPAAKPNIVFVLTDQWRASALGFAGDPNVKTPHLDQLAARRVHFSNAAAARNELVGYYAHCTALDQCVGDLLVTLKETGLAENTLVVFTSDHGEMLGAHAIPPRMKQWPYDEAVHVPFLLYDPRAAAHLVTTPLNTPDIPAFPTDPTPKW